MDKEISFTDYVIEGKAFHISCT